MATKRKAAKKPAAKKAAKKGAKKARKPAAKKDLMGVDLFLHDRRGDRPSDAPLDRILVPHGRIDHPRGVDGRPSRRRCITRMRLRLRRPSDGGS